MTGGGMGRTFGALRQFVGRKPPRERCELCGAALGEEHPHLTDPTLRKLVCACDACAILFDAQGGTKYKRVPRRIWRLADLRLTDAQWASLTIPISMAFFFESSLEQRVVAMYPSPAGATESELPLDAWLELMDANPPLLEMEADVEALLVNRLGPARGFPEPQYYVLPIDECYKLVGLIRTHWRGLGGGTEVWEELGKFLAGIEARSTVRAGVRHA
jgi:uncharacterized protein DUF5947